MPCCKPDLAAARRDDAVPHSAVISSILKRLAGIARAVSAAQLLMPSGQVLSRAKAFTMLARSREERCARLPTHMIQGRGSRVWQARCSQR